MKIIELKFEDGGRWGIPLEFVAKHRANYYKSKREDEFLREVIPTKKEEGVADKLWASGKGIFKKREEIFEDEPTE